MDARIRTALIVGLIFYIAGTIVTCVVKYQQAHKPTESHTIIQIEKNLNK